MGLAIPVRNSARISKRSPENSPPAETTTAEKPKEKLKQDPPQNTTENVSQNKNESKPEIPNSAQNSTNPPKTEKVKEDLPKTELEKKITNLPQNTTTPNPPKDEGNQNQTKTEIENRGVTYKNQNGTKIALPNLNATSADGRSPNITKTNELSEGTPDDEGSIDPTQNPLMPETDDIGLYNNSTGGERQKQDFEIMGPSDRTTFSSGSRAFDHLYFPMVNVVLILWLVVHMFPKAKRFFNWIQKSLTKTDRNIRRRKKQKN